MQTSDDWSSGGLYAYSSDRSRYWCGASEDRNGFSVEKKSRSMSRTKQPDSHSRASIFDNRFTVFSTSGNSPAASESNSKFFAGPRCLSAGGSSPVLSSAILWSQFAGNVQSQPLVFVFTVNDWSAGLGTWCWHICAVVHEFVSPSVITYSVSGLQFTSWHAGE